MRDGSLAYENGDPAPFGWGKRDRLFWPPRVVRPLMRLQARRGFR